MSDMDPSETAMYAAIGAVLLAFALWVVTNWHVLRVGRGIKADIDAKRLATEVFVASQIERIERSVADVSGKVSAVQVPPFPEGLDGVPAMVDDLRTQLNDFAALVRDDLGAMRTKVDELPRYLQILGAQGQAVEQRAFQQAVTESGADVTAALSVREAISTGDPDTMRLAVMKRVAERQVTDAYAEKNPVGAMLLEAGRMKMLEWLQADSPFGARPSGVVRRTTPPGPSGRGNSDI
jgi:hypothetical protein